MCEQTCSQPPPRAILSSQPLTMSIDDTYAPLERMEITTGALVRLLYPSRPVSAGSGAPGNNFRSWFNGFQGTYRRWKTSFAQGDAQAPAPCAKAAAPFRPRLREPLPNALPRAPRPALLPCAPREASNLARCALHQHETFGGTCGGVRSFWGLRTCAVLMCNI